MNEEVIGVN